MIDSSKNINILQITARADFGGGPEHLYKLLQTEGEINYFVAAPLDKPYYQKYYDILGKDKLVEIPHRKFTVAALRKLIQFVKRYNITIVHSHGKGAGIYSRLISIFTTVKCVHTFHGVHIYNYNRLARWTYIVIERTLTHFTNKFIVVSESEKRKVIKYGFAKSEKTTLIPNGVELPKESSIEEKISPPLKVLHISRYDYAKNSLLMYNIIREVQKKYTHDKFEFILIGDGPDKMQLKQKLENEKIENVRFIGYQSDLSEYYKKCFIYISTSRWEGMPLTILEAMSYGIPIIASNVDGNSDLVINSETGYLFDLEQPTKAADYLSQLSEDFRLYSKISKKCLAEIEQKYSKKNMIKETENLYLSLS